MAEDGEAVAPDKGHSRVEESVNEVVLYNRSGRPVYRVCGPTIYDYTGNPRGFVVGKTMYDTRGQLRGFFINKVVRDRMGRVTGFAEGAGANGLKFPLVDIPPVPYKNLPAPELPQGIEDRVAPQLVPAWSMMRLENLLV